MLAFDSLWIKMTSCIKLAGFVAALTLAIDSMLGFYLELSEPSRSSRGLTYTTMTFQMMLSVSSTACGTHQKLIQLTVIVCTAGQRNIVFIVYGVHQRRSACIYSKIVIQHGPAVAKDDAGNVNDAAERGEANGMSQGPQEQPPRSWRR